ncbi:MAG: hypothetical protein SVC26_03930 [Pseudomonadota bacterium]|nr:hypothetical protein [Pseudomonadota bacterium]
MIAAAAVCVQPVLANGVCNPTSTETCGIPFSSNFWATPVLETTTGMELNVSNEILRPEVLEQLPIQDGFTPEGIFNGYSGFSAASAVAFEFASELVASSLPKEGGDTVIAIDLTTGETLPCSVPDIDPSRIMMQGTSLGGVLGSTYGSLPQSLKARYIMSLALV